MGRHCGYLALTSAIAGGADYALIPEYPPADGWEERMCELLRSGRAAGRRDSIVIVAEGLGFPEGPVAMPDGSERKFLLDGDTVILRGWCEKNGLRIGFGEASGKVLPAAGS